MIFAIFEGVFKEFYWFRSFDKLLVSFIIISLKYFKGLFGSFGKITFLLMLFFRLLDSINSKF